MEREASQLTKQQYKGFGPRAVKGYAEGAAIYACIRFDDRCGNGHNTFSVTGTVREPGRRHEVAGGCLHAEIAEAFPEIAHLIKWHLCSTDGPMHYVASTRYMAGDLDCHGKAKGEPYSFQPYLRFGTSPVTHKVGSRFLEYLQSRIGTGEFHIVEVPHSREPKTFGPKYTFAGFEVAWHECPFDSRNEAEEWQRALALSPTLDVVMVPTQFGTGKERELDAARNAAIWPEATNEDLILPGLEDRLLARLPALLEAFRADVEALGFTW